MLSRFRVEAKSIFIGKETLIAELLFLPPSPTEEDALKKAGSRISKRLLKQQKEKDAARLLEGTLLIMTPSLTSDDVLTV